MHSCFPRSSHRARAECSGSPILYLRPSPIARSICPLYLSSSFSCICVFFSPHLPLFFHDLRGVWPNRPGTPLFGFVDRKKKERGSVFSITLNRSQTRNLVLGPELIAISACVNVLPAKPNYLIWQGHCRCMSSQKRVYLSGGQLVNLSTVKPTVSPCRVYTVIFLDGKLEPTLMFSLSFSLYLYTSIVKQNFVREWINNLKINNIFFYWNH